MDRHWSAKGVRRLSFEHLRGVDEFMRFVRRNVAGDAQVLCPCPSCMNRVQQTLRDVEAHLLMRGMACTYDRWIHHGEPLHAEPGAEPEPGEEAHHVDEGGEFVQDDVPQEDAGLEEDDGDEDDRIPDLFKDLYESEPQGEGENTIYAELIEEAKQAASDGGTLSIVRSSCSAVIGLILVARRRAESGRIDTSKALTLEGVGTRMILLFSQHKQQRSSMCQTPIWVGIGELCKNSSTDICGA